MKRILALFILSFSIFGLSAQNQTMLPLGVAQTEDGYVWQNPSTEVWLDVRVAKNEIVAGPYARYAQKMLGITVPLVNKTKYEIVDVQLGYAINPIFPQTTPLHTIEVEPVSTTSILSVDDNGFDKLSVNRISSTLYTTEEMASQAAERIFEIRKYRYDLITGNSDEPISGDGLAALLCELNNQEEALVELFVGRRTTSYKTQRIAVDASRTTCIASRFDEQQGLVAADDLSGMPLVVRFAPVSSLVEPVFAEVKKGPTKVYVVAAIMHTTAMLDKQLLNEMTIPVYQQGTPVEIPVK